MESYKTVCVGKTSKPRNNNNKNSDQDHSHLYLWTGNLTDR